MRKLIFLDIDGVLATPECLKDGGWGLVDRLQNIFAIIMDRTDAEIVLSSSWRKWDLETTKEFMKEEGFLYYDRIVGVTIRAYQYLDRTKKIHLSIPRGVEIKQWIDTNIHSDNGKNWDRKVLGVDYIYVIIDDESDMLLQQSDFFVQTNSEKGITVDNALKVLTILNGNKSH